MLEQDLTLTCFDDFLISGGGQHAEYFDVI